MNKQWVRERKIFGMVERIYSRRRHLGEQGKFQEHDGGSRRI